jgi:hypothetical protein
MTEILTPGTVCFFILKITEDSLCFVFLAFIVFVGRSMESSVAGKFCCDEYCKQIASIDLCFKGQRQPNTIERGQSNNETLNMSEC